VNVHNLDTCVSVSLQWCHDRLVIYSSLCLHWDRYWVRDSTQIIFAIDVILQSASTEKSKLKRRIYFVLISSEEVVGGRVWRYEAKYEL
jgi:hypothetical protein